MSKYNSTVILVHKIKTHKRLNAFYKKTANIQTAKKKSKSEMTASVQENKSKHTRG